MVMKEQRDLLSCQKEELEAALALVKQLEGIIPICSYWAYNPIVAWPWFINSLMN